MQDRGLKLSDVVPDSANRIDQIGIGRRMGPSQFVGRHTQLLGSQIGLVESRGVAEQGRGSSRSTSLQIVRTTSIGERGLPKTSSVKARPAD